MKVVILCGGQGSRIRDISEAIPKPMLPIGARPILWHIMKLYAHHGHTDFVLCLGYKGSLIREFFLNYRAMVQDCTVSLDGARIEFHADMPERDWRVTLVDTGEHTMTGGRLVRVRRYVEGDEPFCLTYGDGVADIDIADLVSTHRKSGLVATVTAVRVAGRFGELNIDDGRVRGFNEKPAVTAGLISGGFFVFDGRHIWQYLDPRDDLVLEREPMDRLATSGQLGVYEHDRYWQCMDTPREHAALNELWASHRAPWRVWS